MSATVIDAPDERPATGRPAWRGKVTQLRVVRSEWTKLWTLRSTRWSLLVAVVAMAGLGPVVAAAQLGRWSSMSAHDRAIWDSINVGVSGHFLAQLAIGVLGVLVIGGEYSTGMIRSSLMAVPKRLPVLWAKLAVFAAATFVLMLAATLVSFLGVQAIASSHHVQHSLTDGNALRVVLGNALYLSVLGLLGVGLGALLRNTAAGISAFVAVMFVLPTIADLLPSSVGDAVTPYMPIDAGTTVSTNTFEGAQHHLSTWGGFAVFCGYTAIVIAAAAIRLRRRDA
jgi:ABC-2 type transport system permease protein